MTVSPSSLAAISSSGAPVRLDQNMMRLAASVFRAALTARK